MRSITKLFFILALMEFNIPSHAVENEYDEAVKLSLAVGYSLANYYCQNSKWPPSLKILKRFDKKHQVVYVSKDEWSYLLETTNLFAVDENIGFYVPYGDPGEEKSVLSKHLAADCELEKLEPVIEVIIVE